MNGLPICGLNIIWKKSDLPFLSLAATQIWEVSLEEQKRASSFKCPGVWVKFDPTDLSFGPK